MLLFRYFLCLVLATTQIQNFFLKQNYETNIIDNKDVFFTLTFSKTMTEHWCFGFKNLYFLKKKNNGQQENKRDVCLFSDLKMVYQLTIALSFSTNKEMFWAVAILPWCPSICYFKSLCVFEREWLFWALSWYKEKKTKMQEGLTRPLEKFFNLFWSLNIVKWSFWTFFCNENCTPKYTRKFRLL